LPVLALALAALMLAGCGSTQPTAVVTPTFAVPDATHTPAVPGMPGNLCADEPMVTEFDVWQDFMPIVPPDGAPLHASLIIEMQCPPHITAADIDGLITLRRASDEVILTAPLQTDGIEDATTTGVRRLFLTMQPAPPPMALTEGESITGTAHLTIAGQQVDVPLPATPLQFTH
jgi:hypothetical protein